MNSKLKEQLEAIMEVLSELQKHVEPPIDPKVYTLMGLAFDCCEHQLQMEVEFPGWVQGGKSPEDNFMRSNGDIPSEDELKDWFNE